MAQNGLKRLQDGPQRLQDGPKLVQDGPKLVPKAPKLAPEAPKMGPKGPQEGPQIGLPRPSNIEAEKGRPPINLKRRFGSLREGGPRREKGKAKPS